MGAEQGQEGYVSVFLEEGFPVNYQHPDNGLSALHYAACSQARSVIKVLAKNEKCDFLLRDSSGRLPSEMAYLYGESPALARYLGLKEARQAEAQGIQLTRRPPREAS